MTHSHECHVSSKYSTKIKPHHHVRTYFPMVCLESQRMHHCHMCSPLHSLHRLYRPHLLLSANLCVHHIAYVCSRTLLFGEPPPPPSTHKGSVSLYAYNHADQNKKVSNKMYLGLYTRVSTHLIMTCSKGKKAETTNQTRVCVRTETI